MKLGDYKKVEKYYKILENDLGLPEQHVDRARIYNRLDIIRCEQKELLQANAFTSFLLFVSLSLDVFLSFFEMISFSIGYHLFFFRVRLLSPDPRCM